MNSSQRQSNNLGGLVLIKAWILWTKPTYHIHYKFKRIANDFALRSFVYTINTPKFCHSLYGKLSNSTLNSKNPQNHPLKQKNIIKARHAKLTSI